MADQSTDAHVGGASAAHDGGAATREDGASTQRRGCTFWAWSAAALVLALVVAAGVAGSMASGSVLDSATRLYLRATSDQGRPPSDDGTPLPFGVGEGQSLPAVAAELEAQGIIVSARRFVLIAKVSGRDRLIQAGEHTLRRDMSADEVLNALLVAEGTDVTVTLPEGLRAEEVADALSMAGLVDRAAFLALVADPASGPVTEGDGGLAATPVDGEGIDVPPIVGLRGVPSLEGYLFPDTYRFAPGAGAAATIHTLLATFADKVTPNLDEDARAIGLDGAAHAITLASIVQREGVRADELPMIARVYLNRLSEPPYILNADPTLQYALGFQSDPPPGTWWKRPLYDADKQVDSPYNSYLLPGLPPAPIASPGLAAIQAVLAPADGPWMYFVASEACDGTHAFAVTYEEHLANVGRYVAAGCGG